MKIQHALIALFAALVFVAIGCHIMDIQKDGVMVVAFTGDSNTIPHPDHDSWGEVFEAMMEGRAMPWQSSIHAVYAAPAGHHPTWPDGYDLLAQALASTPPPDVVVIAVGEVNVAAVALYGCPPSKEVVPQKSYRECLYGIRDILREQYNTAAATGAYVYVATTPPYFLPAWNPTVYNFLARRFKNILIREFGRDHIIDRYTGIGPEHLSEDLVHLNPAGHYELACRLYAAINHRAHPTCQNFVITPPA